MADAQLIIAGAGSKKNDCVTLAKKLAVNNIFFLDVPEGSVEKIQAEADVLLLPVVKKGSLSSVPSKLISYMFSSKPIIATLDFGSETESVITNSRAGWVGLAEDKKWLIAKMKEVKNIPVEELVVKGKNGFDYAVEYFGEEKNLNKLKEIILQ